MFLKSTTSITFSILQRNSEYHSNYTAPLKKQKSGSVVFRGNNNN